MHDKVMGSDLIDIVSRRSPKRFPNYVIRQFFRVETLPGTTRNGVCLFNTCSPTISGTLPRTTLPAEIRQLANGNEQSLVASALATCSDLGFHNSPHRHITSSKVKCTPTSTLQLHQTLVLTSIDVYINVIVTEILPLEKRVGGGRRRERVTRSTSFSHHVFQSDSERASVSRVTAST